MKSLGGRFGLVCIIVCTFGLFSCGDAASNGIFNLAAKNNENWISGFKGNVREEYIPFSDFSKSNDITLWAVYYDGSSQVIPSPELEVSIGGVPITMDPWILTFEGKQTVNVTYNKLSFEYVIAVGAGSGSGGGNDDAGINIIITY